MSSSSSSIVAEVPGFLQVLSDGSVKRFPLPTVAASPEYYTDGYKSKDVVIDAANSVTARIFLPDDTTPGQQLPVVVYFHGGGFCIGSTAWSVYHGFLGSLCVKSQVLILSVDYRLAPEHRLPAAFDDAYLSLQWLARSSAVEPWLERADLSRVFLSGESAGANIVHNVMLRVVREQVKLGLEIKGLMAIHPFFGSEGRVGSEVGISEEAEKWVRMGDSCWQLSLPEGADRDHPACNFDKYDFGEELQQQFPAVKVFVAGLDTLKDRGIMYAEFLKGKGGLTKEVELVIAQGENHAFHVYNAADSSQATSLLLTQIADFINQH